MKIGILTYHRARNYGAYLQACALCTRLRKEDGFEAEVIDFRMQKEADHYRTDWSLPKRALHYPAYRFKKRLYGAFERAYESHGMCCSKESLVSDSLDEFERFVQGRYDVIVAGSDEIWKLDGLRGFPTPYWLIGDFGCRKLSYAASSRSDFSNLSEMDRDLVRDALSSFDYIGVRDDITKKNIEGVLSASESRKIHLNCDPVFLLDPDVPMVFLSEYFKNAKLSGKKKNVVVMVHERELALEIWDRYHESYNLISVFHYYRGFINMPDITPKEWMLLIKNADFVMTTYFHATCFAILFETPFLSFASKKRSSKVSSLFEPECGFAERYVEDGLSVVRTSDDLIRRYSGDFDSSGYVRKQRESFRSFLDALSKEGAGRT